MFYSSFLFTCSSITLFRIDTLNLRTQSQSLIDVESIVLIIFIYHFYVFLKIITMKEEKMKKKEKVTT